MNRVILTPKGINLLERVVVEAFVENPDEIQKAAEILGIDLNSMLQKYIKRYLEIEEDLSRIRAGMKPKYNPLAYYKPK